MDAQTKARSRKLRNNQTFAEQKLWQKLRSKQINGNKFRRQFAIGRYIVDFICLNKSLIIELDGGQHMDNANYDLKRDNWLKSQNFKVLRFWNNQIMNEIDSVLDVISQKLKE
jgi:very-short-patch-repair endonuclease